MTQAWFFCRANGRAFGFGWEGDEGRETRANFVGFALGGGCLGMSFMLEFPKRNKSPAI